MAKASDRSAAAREKPGSAGGRVPASAVAARRHHLAPSHQGPQPTGSLRESRPGDPGSGRTARSQVTPSEFPPRSFPSAGRLLYQGTEVGAGPAGGPRQGPKDSHPVRTAHHAPAPLRCGHLRNRRPRVPARPPGRVTVTPRLEASECSHHPE